MFLTELEIKIIKSSRTNEFGDPAEEPVWLFSVIDNSGIEAKQARGVISSLVQKGLCEVEDYEGKRKANDSTFMLTAKGVEVSESDIY